MGSHTSLHDAGNRRRHLRGYHHGPGENRRPVNRLNTQPENNLHHALGHYPSPPASGAQDHLHTTNAVESLNRVIRKTTKTRGSFPTDAAATKLIYLAIRNFEKAGRCVREWVAARNQFAILYPERFNK